MQPKSAKSGRLRARFGPNRANFGRNRPTLVEFGPMLVDSGLCLPASGPILAEFGRPRPKLSPNEAEVGRSRPTCGGNRAKLEIYQTWSNPSTTWPTSSPHIGPRIWSADLGRGADFGGPDPIRNGSEHRLCGRNRRRNSGASSKSEALSAHLRPIEGRADHGGAPSEPFPELDPPSLPKTRQTS